VAVNHLKRILLALLATLLVAAMVLPQAAVQAQSTPQLSVNSRYILNRYGFAVVQVTVTAANNGSSPVQAVGPGGIGIGLGNLTSHVVGANVSAGYQWTNSSSDGTYQITGGNSVPAGGNTTFSLTALVTGVASETGNGSLRVLILTSPYVSERLSSLTSVISMPASTEFTSAPAGFGQNFVGANVTYTKSESKLSPVASTQYSMIKQITLEDFHPLDVYYASRIISIGSGGNPVVQDTISFRNLGTTPIQTLTVAPLTTSAGKLTIEPASEPPLLSPATVSMSSYGIDLTNTRVGYPIQPGANYTIVYLYALAPKYYNVSGGTVSFRIPLASPITDFTRSYTIQMSLPPGAKPTQQGSSAVTLSDVSPLKAGSLSMGYFLSVGWGLNAGVPLASVLFVVLLLGLFLSRTTSTEEEETEEESATDRASAMIQAFEDKTSLINQLFAEIPNSDPNERSKAYFDELRGRLDTYRNKALQRLNEVKQKATSQKFFDILNQLHTTEREVDRAAKDTLNLYEQYYMNRMRKEVFDRLLPSYKKRLAKGLEQLSEELHVVQRESKLL
jgi:hypothetical protein